MKLTDFNSIEDLAEWISMNIEHIPTGADDIFISVNEIFKYKHANCIDLALLYHQYFKLNHINHGIFQIGLYQNMGINQKGQYHICSYYLENNIYKIVQNLLTDNIISEIFSGTTNLMYSLIKFKNKFLPDYKQLTHIYNATEVIKILNKNDIEILDLYIKNNNIYKKQDKFFKLIENKINILN